MGPLSPYTRFDIQERNRIDLAARQFRAATHDLDIALVAEQAVTLLGGELFDDAELLQMAGALLTVAGVMPVLATSRPEVAMGCSISARWTCRVEAAARPRPLILSRSRLDRSRSCWAVATAWVAVTMTASAKKSSQTSQSPVRRTWLSSS